MVSFLKVRSMLQREGEFISRFASHADADLDVINSKRVGCIEGDGQKAEMKFLNSGRLCPGCGYGSDQRTSGGCSGSGVWVPATCHVEAVLTGRQAGQVWKRGKLRQICSYLKILKYEDKCV